MDHNDEMSRLNKMAPPAMKNTQALRMIHDAQRCNAAEVRTFIALSYPTLNASLYQGPRANVVSDGLKAIMMSHNAHNILSNALYILKYAPDAALTMTVTTFNVSDVLRGMGYSTSVIGKVGDDEAAVKQAIGKSLYKGYDGSTFPHDNKRGYVRFVHPLEGTIVLPISGQQINTNFLRHPKIKKMIYSQQLAEGCELLATFFSFRNGSVVPVQAAEAGKEVMNFESALASNFINSIGHTSIVLKDLILSSSCSDVRGWGSVTLHGTAFAHAIYVAVNGKLGIDLSFMDTFMEMTNSIVTNYLDYDGSNFTVSGAPVSWPRVIAGMRVDLEKKSANVVQAYQTLHVSRGFRGENKGAKGEMSRAGYIGFNLSATLAETSYLLTNLKKFIVQGVDIIVRVSEGGSIGSIVMLLDVLTILEYQGVIILTDSIAIRNLVQERKGSDVKLDVKSHRYGDANFHIVLTGAVHSYCDTGSFIYKAKDKFYVPDKAVIIDLRPVTMDSFSKSKYSEFLDKLSANYDAMIEEWSHFGWPVIGRHRIFEDMFLKKNVMCYSSVEIHNMVAWVTYGMTRVEHKMCYDIDSNLIIKEICAGSIAANILRCMKSVLRVPVISALRQMGFTVVMPEIRGLGKVSVKSAFYARADIQQAIDKGSVAVLEMFKQGDTIVRSLLLSNEESARFIVEGPSTSPEIEKKKEGVSTSSSLDLSKFKTIDEDDTEVAYDD